MNKSLLTKIVVIVAFGMAMGYLEAVVVLYIRKILGLIPAVADLTASEIIAHPDAHWVINIERTREVATIVMLVTFGWLVGRYHWERLAVFLLAFAVWDICYYISLYTLLGWPSSWGTVDCLFLIPVPWIAPVWLPLSVSVMMISAAVYLFWKYR